MVMEERPVSHNGTTAPSLSSARTNREMNTVKKYLRSPLTHKKPIVGSSPCGRVFGMPLDELDQSQQGIPTIVQAVCLFILNNGVHYEGIFRVNGNTRVVDRLRDMFDRSSSSVSLDPGDDIFAVASLLKMFLREIPENLIPEKQTKLFVQTHELYYRDDETLMTKLKALLDDLPAENYAILKYLCRFLVLITLNEKHNKMNATALGIVFGPNLFRCSDDLSGLREQGITNQIVAKFIVNYDLLFSCPAELSPYKNQVLDIETMDQLSPRTIQAKGNKTPRTPPPRPPPPKLCDNSLPERSARSELRRSMPNRPPPPNGASDDGQPVPSPRRNRQGKMPLERHLTDENDYSDDSLKENTTPRSRGSGSHIVRNSLDEDLLTNSRSTSPFLLADSDLESTGPSPLVSVSTSDFVERTIRAAVTEHMFGDLSHSINTNSADFSDSRSYSDRVASRNHEDKKFSYASTNGSSSVTLPAYRKYHTLHHSSLQYSAPVDSFTMVVPTTDGSNHDQLNERHSTSNGLSQSTSPQPIPSPRRKPRRNSLGSVPPINDPIDITEADSDYDSPFDSVKRESEALSVVRRHRGPAGRRTPSRKRYSDSSDDGCGSVPVAPPRYNSSHPHHTADDDDTEGHNHLYRNMDGVDAPISVKFMDKVELDSEPCVTSSAGSSPSASRKPFIPPLDLTRLHQHGAGTDPISIKSGVSLVLREPADDDPLSPPVHVASYSNSAAIAEQVNYKDSVWDADDDGLTMKSITKKIQSLKRRLKSFDEKFEAERGYRPSAVDKANVPEMREAMSDLAKARKEMKRCKERTLMRETSREKERKDIVQERRFSDPGYSRNSNEDVETESPDIYRTFSVINRRLREKRQETARPEELCLMSRDEVREEKLAVQKGLLYFESLHGRPSTKEEKELMRPLYDRYRNVKRLLSSMYPDVSRGADPLLPVVLEDQALDITPITTAKTTRRDPIRIPAVCTEETTESDEFIVTKKPGTPPSDSDFRPVAPPRSKKRNDSDVSLHEMSLTDLLDEQSVVRIEKRRLRKLLKDFEDSFYEETGQKVQKEDRTPMEAEYMAYKQSKAKLRLIDALINKNDPTALV